MDITASTNIKAFSKNQSYKRLRQNHFNLEDREDDKYMRTANQMLSQIQDDNQHDDEYNYWPLWGDIYPPEWNEGGLYFNSELIGGLIGD